MMARFLKTITFFSSQFDDIYEATKSDPYSRAFTMLLMVGLVIWGSLVMINLLVAIIVSDINQVTGRGPLL